MSHRDAPGALAFRGGAGGVIRRLRSCSGASGASPSSSCGAWMRRRLRRRSRVPPGASGVPGWPWLSRPAAAHGHGCDLGKLFPLVRRAPGAARAGEAVAVLITPTRRVRRARSRLAAQTREAVRRAVDGGARSAAALRGGTEPREGSGGQASRMKAFWRWWRGFPPASAGTSATAAATRAAVCSPHSAGGVCRRRNAYAHP